MFSRLKYIRFTFAQAITRAWYQSSYWLWLLAPLSVVYLCLAALRKGLAKPAIKHSVPVLVVGNITVGGTGKTPLVIALVQQLQAAGVQCGVISRGYGSQAHTNKVNQVNLVNASSQASHVGDEPLLIHQATGVPVCVSSQRNLAIDTLLQHHSVDIIISDDGLQHVHLHRDIEWLVVDASRGFGNGYCLPMGPLREPVNRLKSVDTIWFNGTPSQAMRSRLNNLLDNALVPVYTLQPKLGKIKSLLSDTPTNLDGSNNLHVLAGIGNPERFFTDLKNLNYTFKSHVFPDHHAYTLDDLLAFKGQRLLMTAKDKIKIKALLAAQTDDLTPYKQWYYIEQTLSLPLVPMQKLIQHINYLKGLSRGQ